MLKSRFLLMFPSSLDYSVIKFILALRLILEIYGLERKTHLMIVKVPVIYSTFRSISGMLFERGAHLGSRDDLPSCMCVMRDTGSTVGQFRSMCTFVGV